MSKTAYGTLAGVAALAAFAIAQPANALTMKQCSEKYKTANDAGSVGTTSWNDFRKAECGEGATMALKKVKARSKRPRQRRSRRRRQPQDPASRNAARISKPRRRPERSAA